MSKHFFTEINKEFIDLFKKEVKQAESLILSSHIAPDEDAISSILSVYYYLINYLKIDKAKIRILYTGEKLTKWKDFVNFGEVEFVDDIYGYLKPNDLVIFTDGSGWRRFSRRDEIKRFKGKVICVDHHPTPEDKFDIHLVGKNYSSCAEMVYRLFYAEEELTKEICELILMGILGDTGNFRFLKPGDSSVLIIAERLMREGEINIETMQSKYQQIGEKVYLCLIKLMGNSKIMRLLNWPKFMVSWVDTSFVEETKLTDNEISEASGLFTTYLKGVESVGWGFVVTPRLHDKSSSISVRSIPGSVSARILMEQTKFGGGHDRAAGGKIMNKSPEEAVKMLLSWMEKNQPVYV